LLRDSPDLKQITGKGGNVKQMTQSDAKLRELIVHIAALCGNDDDFGKTKLNKILFNLDFAAYRKWGKSISGQEYFALEWGPAPRIMKRVLTSMQSRREIAFQHKERFGKAQEKLIPLRDSNLKLFDKDELNLLMEVVSGYWDRSGSSMSRESHQFLGWAVAAPKEVIPYSVALVSTREPTLDEIRMGEELQSMAQECLARNAAAKTQRDNRRT
jgi:Protein of unknown function (DUF4065)